MNLLSPPSQIALPPAAAARVRVGADVVSIRRLRESVAAFGEEFLRRIYSTQELAYAASGHELWPERLAARFAAKEAALKAFGWSESGVCWRDIEVAKLPDGAPRLLLHGKAAQLAGNPPAEHLALTLTHDEDCAAAVLIVLTP